MVCFNKRVLPGLFLVGSEGIPEIDRIDELDQWVSRELETPLRHFSIFILIITTDGGKVKLTV